MRFLLSLLSICCSLYQERVNHSNTQTLGPYQHNSVPFKLTPNMIINLPTLVAECPPLGQGGMPSINGVIHWKWDFVFSCDVCFSVSIRLIDCWTFI